MNMKFHERVHEMNMKFRIQMLSVVPPGTGRACCNVIFNLTNTIKLFYALIRSK